MSTLKVTNIQDTAGGNSSTSAEIYSGRAKAWVNFNGQGTATIRVSYNVSSITDNGSGDYTVNFSNSLSDSDFATVFSYSTAYNAGVGYGSYPPIESQTSSNVRFTIRTDGNASVVQGAGEPAIIGVVVFR